MSNRTDFPSYTCSRCSSLEAIIVHDRKSGDIICAKCGYVLISRIIDHTSDWAENVGHGNISEAISNVGISADDTDTIFVGGNLLAFSFIEY